MASAGVAQEAKFVEQLGMGYSSAIKANTLATGGNGGGFAFGTAGDFLLHDWLALGLGFDLNAIKINNVVESLSPFFADIKVIAKGRFRPYLLVDPGYSLYYNGIATGITQKGSFYLGGGAGVWFPSKKLLHLFLQAKYNYTSILTSTKGYSGNVSGYMRTYSFLLGYKF
jgi:hypothetical protein